MERPAGRQGAPPLEITVSPGFGDWLRRSNFSIAFTTYQSRKLFLIGMQESGRFSFFERTLERVMGMTARGRDLWLSTKYQVWRFRNALEPGRRLGAFDAVYTPRESRVTGDLDIHDMVVEEDGRLVFVNTLFNCLATVDADHNFRPLWRPPWISALVPEDRCHLNGLAARDGRARYVSAVARTDARDGWREERRDGGVVYDLAAGRVVADGLSMPHSPRWYRDRLWVLNSGTGHLGWVDTEGGKFHPLAFCPGYARGLAFHGGHALVGLSGPRENRTFSGLPLDDNLREQGTGARCGLHVIDLAGGGTVEWLYITGVVRELYDVSLLPGVRCPMAIGFQGDEIERYISLPPGVS